MNQKGFVNIILIIVIVAVIAIGGYFVFLKKSGPITSQQGSTNQTPPPTSSASNQPAVTSQNKTSGWKTYQSQGLPFKIQYPDDWVVVGKDEIGTAHQTQRKAVGFEIQNPGDGNRIVTVRDALISFSVENKSDYYKLILYADGSTGNFICHSPKEYFSPSQSSPVYSNVMGKSIEVCLFEQVEDASYPFRPNIYIPIDNDKGLVITGRYSSESKNTMEKFLQTFQQLVSTFEFVR